MARITKIKKRDGSIEPFNAANIETSIRNAIEVANAKDGTLAKRLTKQIISELEKHFKTITVTASDVQDILEEVLLKHKKTDILKAYLHYQEQEKQLTNFKTYLGIRDELGLKPNALRVLAARYLLRDNNGNITETPTRLFRRVAKAVAKAELNYKKGVLKKTEEEFYELLSSRDFLPNSPALMNAGAPLGQLSACFVLPVNDNLESIFDAVKQTALIHQSGGGTGFNFSNIRPRGDIINTTKGAATGPISFMHIFDETTAILKQGGKRRGANMGILRADHPDIIEFISTKHADKLANFNLSIAADETFMNAVINNKDYNLINPRTGESVKKLNAQEVFNLIVTSAWRTGDPGLVFIDEINNKNPTRMLGRIESTNPCGEQPLHPYESCTLGSINLANMIKKGTFNWTTFKKTIHTAVHFLDNVIDVNNYPLPEIEATTKANRRIGLGVMGFAETLIALGIPYESDKALEFAEKLAKFLNDEARKASNKLAEERDSFPNFDKSIWKEKVKATRNATVTTIAPTGTISIIAGATSGIEPIFAVSFIRDVMEGTHLLEVNPAFEKIARKRGFYSKALMMTISKTGSVQKAKGVPRDVQKLFKTALEIKPEHHVKMQAAFQKHIENAVSKTINLPEDATTKDIRNAYLLAYKLHCKGITVYRYGSKPEQVLYLGTKKHRVVSAKPDYAGGHLCTECMH